MSKTAISLDVASRLNAFSMDPMDVMIVGLDTNDGPDHVLYDSRIKLPLDDAMVRNIMVHGVIQPINVTKDDNDRVLVVAGRQRVRHAREANKRLHAEGKAPLRIPVMTPRKGDGAELFGVAVSENEIRRADGFKARAEKARLFVEKFGYDKERTGLEFGVSGTTIGHWLKYFDLAPALQRAIESGKMDPSVGAELAKHSKEEQVKRFGELLAEAGGEDGEGKITVRAARDKQRQAEGKDAQLNRSMLKKILAHDDAKNLPEDFIKGLRVVLGDLPVSKVAGLTAIINDIAGPKKEAAAVAADSTDDDSDEVLGPPRRAKK